MRVRVVVGRTEGRRRAGVAVGLPARLRVAGEVRLGGGVGVRMGA